MKCDTVNQAEHIIHYTLCANKVAHELLPGDGYNYELSIKHEEVDNILKWYFRTETELNHFLRVYEDMGWTEFSRKWLNR